MSIKVIATQEGYYGSAIRRAGLVFSIAKAEDFGSSWMRPYDSAAAKQLEKELEARKSRKLKLVAAVKEDRSSAKVSAVDALKQKENIAVEKAVKNLEASGKVKKSKAKTKDEYVDLSTLEEVEDGAEDLV